MGTQEGNAIVAGYSWTITVKYERVPAAFPDGIQLTAQVRPKPKSTTLLATLTLADGDIVRVDDDNITVTIGGDVSEAWINEYDIVYLDVVRTDADPDEHYGFQLGVPVIVPVTRDL
jgi:hypothetical protein